MELFSMGVGNYTEKDVQAAARAFTGWTVQPDGTASFNAGQFDRGPKSFLGATVTTADEVVDTIVAQPATARFVAGKLFTFFAYPSPEPEVIGPLADAFQRSTTGCSAGWPTASRASAATWPRTDAPTTCWS